MGNWVPNGYPVATLAVVSGVIRKVLPKLAALLVEEYKLQKAVKGEIMFLKAELEMMKIALMEISGPPANQRDRIWARELSELTYDTEDIIHIFMLSDRSVRLFRKVKIMHGISIEISKIKTRVVELHDRRTRYAVNFDVGTPGEAAEDPRLFAQSTEVEELAAMDETRDELINTMTEENEVAPPALVQEMTGALPSVIAKLGELLAGKYNLQKAVKKRIDFLQRELESINAAIEPISKVPAGQLLNQEKIWARKMRELCCYLEDSIDKFMSRYNSSNVLKQPCFNKVINHSRNMLMRPSIANKFSTEIIDIIRRVNDVCERRRGYYMPVIATTVDPHLFTQYTDGKGDDDGIDEAKDEVIKIMTQENEVSPTLLVQERSMGIVTGPVPSVAVKLDKLLLGDYNLHSEVKEEIRYLQDEVESMNGALEDLSKIPADQLPNRDKIWARQMRELCCNLEDSIDKFMARHNSSDVLNQPCFNKVIDQSCNLLMRPNIVYKFSIEIRDIKNRVTQMNERRTRYQTITLGVDRPVTVTTVDPHLFTQYTDVKVDDDDIDEAKDEVINIMSQENEVSTTLLVQERSMGIDLVGIDEARDELIKIMTKENEVSMRQGKIVSIVGFGGLGKTTLANAVYEKIRARFDCCAFVSVSKTPDLKRLFKSLLYELAKKNVNEETLDEKQLSDVLRGFLQDKRYFIVIDDIRDISTWEAINYGLPDNNLGYRIIATTCDYSVAEQAGGTTYKMRPLSMKNAQKLLYRRIFGDGKNNSNEDTENWPNEGLTKVSELILKKCAGIPLAIITISGVLAYKARNGKEWYKVYKYVGTGLENDQDVNNMTEILLFSYYELPWHLRACLLYLSMFPNDSKIDKDRIIWMWIAEGFIQHEKHGKSLFEHGESYLHELINRSMIQSIYDPIDRIYSCRIQNMMLDFICSQSTEENFVATLNGMDATSWSDTIRRLSIQNGKADNAMIPATRSLQNLRSVVIFPPVDPMLVLSRNFRILRVLDLQDCDLSQSCYGLNYLGNFLHLKYLGLSNTRIAQLPEEVGNLQSLQTLRVTCNEIGSLPSTVVELIHLMCLRIDMDTRVPNGIARLTSLEELSHIGIYDSTDIKVVCCLTELRVLSVSCHMECMDGLEKSLVECLCKLQKLQNLSFWVASGEYKLDLEDVPLEKVPRHLRRLKLQGCWLSSLPAWVNPSLLMNLSSISIAVIELQKEDLERLGRLPALCYLNLKVDHENLGILGEFVIDAGLFPCLRSCVLWGFKGAMIYTQGAMPRLTSLRFTLHVRGTREIAGGSDGGYSLGIENLLSLQDVTVLLRCGGASNQEVQQVKAALRHATKIHPNNPTIEFIGYEDKEEMMDWT